MKLTISVDVSSSEITFLGATLKGGHETIAKKVIEAALMQMIGQLTQHLDLNSTHSSKEAVQWKLQHSTVQSIKSARERPSKKLFQVSSSETTNDSAVPCQVGAMQELGQFSSQLGAVSHAVLGLSNRISSSKLESASQQSESKSGKPKKKKPDTEERHLVYGFGDASDLDFSFDSSDFIGLGSVADQRTLPDQELLADRAKFLDSLYGSKWPGYAEIEDRTRPLFR